MERPLPESLPVSSPAAVMSSGHTTAVGIAGRQSLLPVTALEFCSLSGSLHLLAGEGPQLKVFSTSQGLLATAELLPFCRIHGIRPSNSNLPNHPQSSGDGIERDCSVVIFGQKRLRFVTLTDAGSSLRIECGPASVCLDDWILDVCWLESSGGSSGNGSCSVAAVTAHNTVHIIESSGRDTRVVANYYCKVNCILYSARLEDPSEYDLTVVSGTVFNDILLWRITGRRETSSATANSSESGAERERVCLTLSGHEGVIFSVRISDCGSRLVSVSDDRTVRVWDLPLDWKSMRGEVKSCSLVLYGHTARVWDGRLLCDGHVISIGEDATCRVWDGGGRCVKVVEGHRGRSIWSMAVDEYSGLVVGSATGGGDCSIRLFSLQTRDKDYSWSMETKLPASESAEETPRLVELCGRTVLCLSVSGLLYAADIPLGVGDSASPGAVWRLIHRDTQFSGHAAMALSPDSQWLALGGLQGVVALLHLGVGRQQTETLGTIQHSRQWGAHQGKVFSLTWLQSFQGYPNCLLSCGPSGEMVVWGVPDASAPVLQAVTPLAHLRLPLSKHRWLTAAVIIPSQELPCSHTSSGSAISTDQTESCWLVCGDRKGSLHVFKLSPSKEDPLQSLRGVHGANGVSHISLRRGLLVSCGRDGHSRTFSLNSHTGILTQLSSYRLVKGMDWVERQFLSGSHHLVLGFHATNMVLHSVTENRQLMRVSCGGGHRSYGFTPLSQLLQRKEAVVVYIKKSIVSIAVVDLTLQLADPVLQRGFVGREAVSLQIVHSDPATGCGLIAVGSEDCSVCLLNLQPFGDGGSLDVSERRFLQGHISTVRALSTSPSAQTSHSLLFSGGARASLKVWKIRVGEVSGGDEQEVVLETELSIHDHLNPHQRRRSVKRRKRWRGPGAESLVPECRIMSLTSLPLASVMEAAVGQHYVAAGCSDGIIRHYAYHEEAQSFSSLGDLEYHSRCILTVSHLVLPSHCLGSRESRRRTLCLFSAATDGRVAVWTPLSPAGSGEDSNSAHGPRSSHSTHSDETIEKCIRPLTVCQAHQSGVNDLSIRQVSDEFYLISTVGDDNALAVLGLSVSADSLHLELIATEISAHASSITGVSFLGEGLLVTSSIDQRLNVWKVGFSGTDGGDESATLALANSHTHDIADASSLVLYNWQEGRHLVVVCGIGLQCFVIETQPS